MRSKTLIYKENNKHQYKHFEMIEYLNQKYHNIVQKELKKLNKISNKSIEHIVNRIPDDLLSNMHKKYIINYLKIRRDILLSMQK